MGFSSSMKSVKNNLRLKGKRSFLRNNKYISKGSVTGSKVPRRKYQSFFDKLAILILNKMGYTDVA